MMMMMMMISPDCAYYAYYYSFLFRSARSVGLRQCPAIRGSCFSFLDPLDIWQDPLAGGSVQRKASTYTGQHNTERRRQISMHRAGFESAIPMFERPKTVLALDRSVIETGLDYA
jgi:hypothetical protein